MKSSDFQTHLEAVLAALLIVIAVQSRTADAGTERDYGTAVMEATEQFYAALNRGDAAAADQFLLPGGDSFPRDGGRLSPEAPTEQESLRELLARFRAGLRFDVTMRELQVKVYGDTAIATFYTSGPVLLKDKKLSDGSYRATYVWVSRGGNWKIAHFHLSPLKS